MGKGLRGSARIGTEEKRGRVYSNYIKYLNYYKGLEGETHQIGKEIACV